MSKYDDHLPLYCQAEIFAREGVNLETSTMSGWVGVIAAALAPLIDALAADVMASDTLHVTTRRYRCWRQAPAKNQDRTAMGLRT